MGLSFLYTLLVLCLSFTLLYSLFCLDLRTSLVSCRIHVSQLCVEPLPTRQGEKLFLYYFLYGCSQFYDNLSDGVKTKIRANSSDWCIVSLGETSSSDSSFIFVLGRVLREVSPCICQSADAPLAQAQY
jgi:hypothetical protein